MEKTSQLAVRRKEIFYERGGEGEGCVKVFEEVLVFLSACTIVYDWGSRNGLAAAGHDGRYCG